MEDSLLNAAGVIIGVFATSAVLLTAVWSFVCVRCIKSKQNHRASCRALNQPECRFINDVDGYQVECIDKPSPSSNDNRCKPTSGAFFKMFSKRHYRNRSLQRALPDLPRSPAPAAHASNITRESSSSELYATVDKKSSSYSGTGIVENTQDIHMNGLIRELVKDRVEDRKTSTSRTTRRNSSSSFSSLNATSADQNHLYSRIKGNDDDLYAGILPKIKNDIDGNYNETLYNIESISNADPFYAKLSDMNRLSDFTNQLFPATNHLSDIYDRANHFGITENLFKKINHFNANDVINQINNEDPYSSIRSEENYSPLDIVDGKSATIAEKLQHQEMLLPSTSNGKEIPTSHFRVPFVHNLRKFSPKLTTKTSLNRPHLQRTLSDSGTDYSFGRKNFATESLYSRPLPRHSRPTKARTNCGDIITEQENDDDSLMIYNSCSNNVEGPEPNYRYLTVRESLDVLMARLAQQRAPEVTNSDPNSLHYYSTISEHNYETVPHAIACNLRTINQTLQDSTRRKPEADPAYIDASVTYDYDLNMEQNLPSCSYINRTRTSTQASNNHVTRISIDDCGATNDDNNYFSSACYSGPEKVFPSDKTDNSSVSFIGGRLQNSGSLRTSARPFCTECACNIIVRKKVPCFCACHSDS